MSLRHCIALPLALVLFGCGSTEPVDGLVVLENEGTLCFYDDAPTFFSRPDFEAPVQVFDAGSRLHLQVSVPGCLSSSCDVNRSASCSVSQDEQVIRVFSQLSYEETGDEQCTMDCGILSATCESEELAVGTYTVQHGDKLTGLAVPSVVPACGE